jgi:hypothetical protein
VHLFPALSDEKFGATGEKKQQTHSDTRQENAASRNPGDSINGVFPDFRTTNGMTWHDISSNMPLALPGEIRPRICLGQISC